MPPKKRGTGKSVARAVNKAKKAEMDAKKAEMEAKKAAIMAEKAAAEAEMAAKAMAAKKRKDARTIYKTRKAAGQTRKYDRVRIPKRFIGGNTSNGKLSAMERQQKRQLIKQCNDDNKMWRQQIKDNNAENIRANNAIKNEIKKCNQEKYNLQTLY
jgi:hypothetical protein